MYNIPRKVTAFLQSLSLCIEDALRGADDELAINEELLNSFTVIHPFIEVLHPCHNILLWLDM